MTDKKGQKTDTQTQIIYVVGNEYLDLGTITQTESFETYKQLTGPQTPFPVCCPVDIQLSTMKTPGADQPQLIINRYEVRGRHPLCNPNSDVNNKSFCYYAGECIKTIKERRCPDPFMRVIAEKFLNNTQKNK